MIDRPVHHRFIPVRLLLVALMLATVSMLLRGQETARSSSAIERSLDDAEAARSGLPTMSSHAGLADRKCGLWISGVIREGWSTMSEGQRARARTLLAAPATDTSRVIGRFRLWYDTTGVTEPALLAGRNRIPNSREAYVDSVGAVFNSVYHAEVESLGFASPLSLSRAVYDVYITNLSYYGETVLDTVLDPGPPVRYGSYIRIDNDYLGFYSPGISGLMVTAAHEFHHAIQTASYGYWDGERYFMEMTSTWMEDVVYDQVNDYYAYLQYDQSGTILPLGQFDTPELSFSQLNGLIEYSRAVWGKFIEQRFSFDRMRQTWELIRGAHTLQAIDQSLMEVGSSFRSAFLEWADWNARTGPAADTVTYYREGRHYPPIRKRAVVEFMAPARSIEDSIELISSVYHPTLVNGNGMLAIISNVDLRNAPGTHRFTYDMRSHADDSYKRLANGIAVKLLVTDPANWVSEETVPSIVDHVVPFPNPFLVRPGITLNFRLPKLNVQPTATLYVFSAGMDRIFHGDLTVEQRVGQPYEPIIRWIVLDDRGESPGTGVYIFVITLDGETYTGKFSLVRE